MQRLGLERRLSTRIRSNTAMATTHTNRRRQRVTRRTTSSTVHARPHRPAPARQNRAAAPVAVAAALAPAEVAEPVKAVVRPVRAPDSDDHLAAYFRQLAEHDLLSPEDERELSQ